MANFKYLKGPYEDVDGDYYIVIQKGGYDVYGTSGGVGFGSSIDAANIITILEGHVCQGAGEYLATVGGDVRKMEDAVDLIVRADAPDEILECLDNTVAEIMEEYPALDESLWSEIEYSWIEDIFYNSFIYDVLDWLNINEAKFYGDGGYDSVVDATSTMFKFYFEIVHDMGPYAVSVEDFVDALFSVNIHAHPEIQELVETLPVVMNEPEQFYSEDEIERAYRIYEHIKAEYYGQEKLI